MKLQANISKLSLIKYNPANNLSLPPNLLHQLKEHPNLWIKWKVRGNHVWQKRKMIKKVDLWTLYAVSLQAKIKKPLRWFSLIRNPNATMILSPKHMFLKVKSHKYPKPFKNLPQLLPKKANKKWKSLQMMIHNWASWLLLQHSKEKALLE